jgi:sigma-B regulation protein RsbU (phosphoserine phosphatase)
LILKDSGSDLFLTATYATLDTDSGHVVYANGGHNPAIWLQSKTGEIQELAAPGIALGALRSIELEQGEIEVTPGDVLVFYTDGVTEAMDASHELFDVERLQAVVAASAGASAQQVLDKVVKAVETFAGKAPQSDDVTAFVVRRSP